MSKKIVHIVLNQFTHDSRVIRECKSLANNGYDVTVIAYWLPGLKLEEMVTGYKIIRIPITTKSWSKNPLIQIIKYIEFLIRSLLLIKKIKPDICHSHNPDGLLVGYLSKLFWKSKLIYDSHELWAYTKHLQSRSSILYKIGIVLEKAMIVKVDFIITVNDSIANIISKQTKSDKIIVIHNVSEYKPIKNKFKKDYFQFPNVENILIYVGAISKGRGLTILINIFKNIDQNIGLVIVGEDCMYKNDLIQLVNDYDLNNRVRFVNAVKPDEVITICSMADVGIAPIENICKSFYYSLPNKVYEYIQAGIPVLCSDFPEMKNIVEKYSLGEVFNIDEPSSLIKVINNCFNNPDKIDSYKQNCIRASKILNWKNEEKELFNLYNQL